MKIVFITVIAGGSWGGSEELWSQTAAYALQEGHHVLVSTNDCENPNPKIIKLQKDGALMHYRPQIKPEHDYRLHKRIVRKLIRIIYNPKGKTGYKMIEEFQPDIIVISQGGCYELISMDLMKFIQQIKIPYMLICQSYNEMWIPDDLQRSSIVNLYDNAKKVFFVSQNQINTIQRQLAKNFMNFNLVKQPINLKQFSILDPPDDNDCISVAMVASLDVKWKGHDIVFEILNKEHWSERQWKLNIYGKGPDLNYLKELAMFFSVADRIHFHGHVSDIRTVWTANHILLMPSRQEGAPLALVEAMLCGRPAVVTDVGEMGKWIKEEQSSGYLAEAPTIYSFGNALERAWQQKDKWSEMGKNAFDFAINNIDNNPHKTLLNHITSK